MKKTLKKYHKYIALIFGIFILSQATTGAILTFEKQIVNYQISKNHEFATGEQKSISEIVNAAWKKTVSGSKLHSVIVPSQKNPTVLVRFFRKENGKVIFTKVIFDPVSLDVLAVKDSNQGFFRFVESLHTNLLIDGKLGRNLVGIEATALLFLVISGIILWWPRKNHFVESLKFKAIYGQNKAEKRKFYYDLHKFIGVWGFILLFFISLSGFYLSFHKQIDSFFFGDDKSGVKVAKLVPETSEKAVKKEDFMGRLKIAQMIAPNLEQFKNMRLVAVIFPQNVEQDLRLNFIENDAVLDIPSRAMIVDQEGSEIRIKSSTPKPYFQKLVLWMGIMHKGQGFGVIWQCVLFFTGIVLITMVILGFKMWLLRPKHRN